METWLYSTAPLPCTPSRTDEFLSVWICMMLYIISKVTKHTRHCHMSTQIHISVCLLSMHIHDDDTSCRPHFTCFLSLKNELWKIYYVTKTTLYFILAKWTNNVKPSSSDGARGQVKLRRSYAFLVGDGINPMDKTKFKPAVPLKNVGN